MTTVRTTATLAVAVVVFAAGLFIGFRLLTAKADTAEAAATCTNRTVAKGERLTTNLVAVNVLNASNRSGLANRVTINLQRKGFLSGSIGNSTSKVKPRTVTILTRDQRDPRVRLVAAQFRNKVSYAVPDIPVASGVTVLVGDDYTALRTRSASRVPTDRTIRVCVPTVTLP